MKKFNVGFPGVHIGVYYADTEREAKEECEKDVQDSSSDEKAVIKSEIRDELFKIGFCSKKNIISLSRGNMIANEISD